MGKSQSIQICPHLNQRSIEIKGFSKKQENSIIIRFLIKGEPARYFNTKIKKKPKAQGMKWNITFQT